MENYKWKTVAKRAVYGISIAFLAVQFNGCKNEVVKLEPIDGIAPKVIAHRGAWNKDEIPENSISALKAAHKLQVYGSEFDVQYTKDSVLVVNHDNNFKGLDISKRNYNELLQKKLSNGEHIPTLEEYIKIGRELSGMRLILEIKESKAGEKRTLAVATKAVEMVKRLDVADITDFISFNFNVCKEIHRIAPEANIQYLGGDKSPETVFKAGINGIGYSYQVLSLRPDWIKDAHKKGMKVNVWTVNNESKMKNMINKKVDFITTDEPQRLMEILAL
ncbi:glycerophosphodiester phosphodiesterase family protein [Sphingobacterium sp.]|uniref:glycerophosphodiester phosphodiesterase n=1 Tax=Sphingobacterium sp. TaxID=341027 RepID=UPI0031DDF420